MADNEVTIVEGIDVNVPDPEAVEAGTYELRLIGADIRKQKPEKGQGRFIFARFAIVGEQSAKSVTNVMMFPDGKDEDRDYMNKLTIRRFYDAFGVDYSGSDVDLADGKGNTHWAILGVETNPQYGDQNKIQRWVTED